jgi:hypothetical protein
MMSAQNDAALFALVLIGFGLVILWRVLRWFRGAAVTPDPWGPEVEEILRKDEALEVCPHCLTPQQHTGWFCPECGSTVGPYSNYMPYIYIFSQGEVLRSGVTLPMPHRRFVLLGYLLFSFSMFSALAPVYWFFLLRNAHRPAPAE